MLEQRAPADGRLGAMVWRRARTQGSLYPMEPDPTIIRCHIGVKVQGAATRDNNLAELGHI